MGENREVTALPSVAASMQSAVASSLRPPPDMSPATFAETYRVLHAVYCSESPGKWNNENFPYQPHVMNAVREAISEGKRGVVFMKAGQIGGTDCMINAQLWLKEYFPGPQLFMTSTDKIAAEFGRERFGAIINDMPPLLAKYLPNKRGDILTKRFVDGKIVICGGQSVFNLQSTPYRVVVIDELDSLVANLGGSGDPLKLAEVRLDSFRGPTLMIAYAHPSVKDRGAAKMYYEMSDQRRAFVKHDCGGEFWLQWSHVRAVPHEGMTKEQAERDPSCYGYYCPVCGVEIMDSERVSMVRKLEYKSTLPPAVAKRKPWIGVHASQLYTPAKTIYSFALRWIECLDSEENKRVFYNKVLGEPYESQIKKSSIEDWRRLIVVPRRAGDTAAYHKGEVPPGVRFLTAGQDSRSTQFHYAVWGWGLAITIDNKKILRRWLIDWDTVKREKSEVITSDELKVFDGLIYDRYFPAKVGKNTFTVRECAHDTGWSPIGVYDYTKEYEGRAIPIKGGADTSLSKSPPFREGHKPKYKLNGHDFELDQPLIVFNTYLLKFDWYNTIQKQYEVFEYENGREQEPTGKNKVNLVNLPVDVDDDFLEQASSEFLTAGKRKGEQIWHHEKPNHYGDCNIYSYGLALKINPFQKGLTAEQDEEQKIKQVQQQRRRFAMGGAAGQSRDASLG